MTHMVDKDVIFNSLLQRSGKSLQLSLAATLREEQKDEIIGQQATLILQLQERVARLEKNSTTSSKPPSSDITAPPPQNANYLFDIPDFIGRLQDTQSHILISSSYPTACSCFFRR